MHIVVCMRCGADVEDLYRSKNPAWADWDLCEDCVQEIDAELQAHVEETKKRAQSDSPQKIVKAGCE